MNEAKYRFFCEDPDRGYLSEEESAHAIRVLRLKAGDAIQVMDGKGRLCLATITGENKKQTGFRIVSEQRESTPVCQVHIAIAPTKNLDRFSFFLEKVTEIGVTRVTPVITKNSERRELKVDKLRKNLVAAAKQSGNLFLPDIDEPVELQRFLSGPAPDGSLLFIAHCREDQEKTALAKHPLKGKKVVILIGPEGDFTAEEVNLAKQKNFVAVNLGESRLRTETAGIVACHTVHLISSL